MPTVTLSGVQVTFDKLDKSNPTTVQNAVDLGATSEFNPVRSVLLFDTSGITGPVTVSAATFTATGNAGDTNAVNDIDFLKLLTEPVIGQATWNSYSTGNSWASDSGFNATDAVLTPAFTINDFLIAAANTNTSAGLIALAQDWINNPGNNKGLLVKFVDDTVANSAYIVFSSPTLEIVYTAGGGPTVSTVSSNSASEGSSIVHTVTLSGATSGTTNFAASLVGGTATGGGTDYTSDLAAATYSNGVTFSAGNMVVPTAVSSWTVSIPTTSDIVVEGPETYTLTVGGVSGTGTINDLVVFTVNSVDLGSFTGFATFTITASATSGVDRAVNYATTDGTAANGVDYTAVSGTATILAGNLTVDVLVPIINTRKPDTDLVTTGWTVTGAANHSAALADNTDTSYTTSPDVTASPGPLKTQMLPTPLAAGTHTRQIRANYTSTPCDVKMSLLNSSDVVQGDSGWISVGPTAADHTMSITTTGTSTRFQFDVRPTP